MIKKILNMTKRIICFSLFALCLVAFTSCSFADWVDSEFQDDTNDTENDFSEDDNYSTSFTLARFTGERLDPYLSKNRTNRDLLSLCYDPLIYADNSCDPVCVIASDFEQGDNYVAFTISSDARFSDGTYVTASDCVYSYSVAMDPESVYVDRFEYISDFKALSDGRFAVYFNMDSMYNVNLCDIPIIKVGTNGDFISTGSGKYCIIRDNASVYLEKNPYSMVDNGENFEVSKISVHDISSTEELLYNFNYNKIHGAYSDITDDGIEFRGNIETISFCDNSLVFAVVNRNNAESFISDPLFSKGITYCIDRTSICEEYLSGGTEPTWYPFNPDWSVTSAADLNDDIYSTVDAHEFFTASGAVLTGTVRTVNEIPIELKLVVNSENLTKVEVAESVAKDLENMGFSVIIESLTWDKYTEAVRNGDYDIYIAEVLLPLNMDIGILLSDTVNTGCGYYSERLIGAIDSFNSGNLSMRDFLRVFQEELPFIPLYFNRGALAVNRVVSGDFAPAIGNIYNGIENWIFS